MKYMVKNCLSLNQKKGGHANFMPAGELLLQIG